MTSNLDILYHIGFEHIGEWKLENDLLSFEIIRHSNEHNILYAFVANSDIKYIGKSTQTFKARLNAYKNPGISQKTNIKNKKNILALLKQDIPVGILVFVNKEEIQYRGIPINIAAGLEDNLIARIKPQWNETGK